MMGTLYQTAAVMRDREKRRDEDQTQRMMMGRDAGRRKIGNCVLEERLGSTGRGTSFFDFLRKTFCNNCATAVHFLFRG